MTFNIFWGSKSADHHAAIKPQEVRDATFNWIKKSGIFFCAVVLFHLSDSRAQYTVQTARICHHLPGINSAKKSGNVGTRG